MVAKQKPLDGHDDDVEPCDGSTLEHDPLIAGLQYGSTSGLEVGFPHTKGGGAVLQNVHVIFSSFVRLLSPPTKSKTNTDGLDGRTDSPW
jgi:hypothetical protein